MEVSFHHTFKKRYRKISTSEQKKCDERIAIFMREPFHRLLNNHALSGTYHGYRSINVTGDLRAMYEPVSENSAFFILLGSHAELYG